MDYMLDHDLTVGKVGKEDYELSFESRLNNVAVYGAKGSGKSRRLFLYFANLQMSTKDEGATFIVDGPNQTLILKELAKKYQRDVLVLHPEMFDPMSELVYLGFDTEKEITNKVVDFEKVFKKKMILIIDVEMSKSHKNGLNALKNLMYMMQMNLHHCSVDSPHFVYIDHAELLFGSLYNLLYFGSHHGVGTTLFFQSREYISKVFPEQTLMMEANVRTNITLPVLTYEDKKYFTQRFYGGIDSLSQLKDKQSLIIESCNDGVFEATAVTDVSFMKESFLDELEEEALRSMNKGKRVKKAKKRDPKPPHLTKKLYNPHENTNKIPLSDEGFDHTY